MVFRWFSKFWGQWSTIVYFTLCGLFLAPFGPFLTLFELYLKKNTISSPCEWILFGSKWLTLCFEETIANFQWFLRRPSPLNVFWAVWPLPSMVLRWFFDVATIAFDGFWWFRTIGQTMRWFRWIVVVYKRPLIPLHTRTIKRTCESTTKVCWGSHCKIHFWGLGSNSIQEISFFRVTRKKSVGARLQLSGIQTFIFWEPRIIYVAVQSWDLKIHSSGSQDFIFWDANFFWIQTFVVCDPNCKIHIIHPTIQL